MRVLVGGNRGQPDVRQTCDGFCAVGSSEQGRWRPAIGRRRSTPGARLRVPNGTHHECIFGSAA